MVTFAYVTEHAHKTPIEDKGFSTTEDSYIQVAAVKQTAFSEQQPSHNACPYNYIKKKEEKYMKPNDKSTFEQKDKFQYRFFISKTKNNCRYIHLICYPKS